MRSDIGPSFSMFLTALGIMAAIALATAAVAAGRNDADTRAACDEVSRLPPVAQAEVLSLARILALKPAIAIDFRATTNELCLNTGGGVMAHFSSEPSRTEEDIVYFVDAAPLVAKGLRLAEFPAIDPRQGSMRPGAWYRYEGKGKEPHHGREMGDRTWLILAVDVK